jgi:NAD(P)-dependent dehydrogenase (short-subunit alcohol dehydrogenase family)
MSSSTVALVTGGGSGIGLAIAQRLVSGGHHVVITGRTESKLQSAVEQLGTHCSYVVGDAADEGSVAAAIASCATFGQLTVAVANAGTGSGSPFLATPLDEWNRVVHGNLTSTFLLFKHAGGAMAANNVAAHGGGALLAISSVAAARTHRFMTAYCVSKAGVDMLVQNVADELGPLGIRVNAIRPSLVPTDISAGLTQSPSIVNDYLSQMPLGRLGTTDDIASLAAFLLGPESSWITGMSISTDGGHHLRRGPNLDAGC